MKWLFYLFASAFSLICEESCIRSCKAEKGINKCISDCGCVEEEISLVIDYVDLAFVMQKIPLEFNDIIFKLTGCSLYCEEPCWNFNNKSEIFQCLKECNCFELIGIEKVSERIKIQKTEGKNIENQEADIEEIISVNNDADIGRNYNDTEEEIEKNDADYDKKENEIENYQEDLRFNINKTSVIEEEFSNKIDQEKGEEIASWNTSVEFNFTKIFESLIKNMTAGIFDQETEQNGQFLNGENKDEADSLKLDKEFMQPSNNSIEETVLIDNLTEAISLSEGLLEDNGMKNDETNNTSVNPDSFLEENLFSGNAVTQDLLPSQINTTLHNLTEENYDFEHNESSNFIEKLSNRTQEIVSENYDEELLKEYANKTQEIDSENYDEELLIENKTKKIKSENSAEDINKSEEMNSAALPEALWEEDINKSEEMNSTALPEALLEGDTNKIQEINSEASTEEVAMEEANDTSLQVDVSYPNSAADTPDHDSENIVENNKESSEDSQYQVLDNSTLYNYSSIELNDIKANSNVTQTSQDSSIFNYSEAKDTSFPNTNETISSPDTSNEAASNEIADQDDRRTSNQLDGNNDTFYYEAQKLSELRGEAETYKNKSQEIEITESTKSIENVTQFGLVLDNYEYFKKPIDKLEEHTKKYLENTTKIEEEINKDIEKSMENSIGDRKDDLESQKDILIQEAFESLSDLEIAEAENKNNDSETTDEDTKIFSNSQEVNFIENPKLDNEASKNPEANIESESKLQEAEAALENTKTIPNSQDVNLIETQVNETPQNPEANLDALNKQQSSESIFEDKTDSSNSQEVKLIENHPKNPDNEASNNPESNPQSNLANPSSTKVSIGPSNCMVQCSQMCKKQESELKCLEDCLTAFCKTFEENSSWSTLFVIAGNGFSLMFVVYCIWKFIKRKRYDDDDSMFAPRYYNIS